MVIVSSVTTARQVVELSGPEAMRPGPVWQRGLCQQEFERPPGIVEYLLPRQPRGRSCPDLVVAGHCGDPRKVASPVARENRTTVDEGHPAGPAASTFLVDGGISAGYVTPL
jgi:hypothetical protein